jgi:SAM-dependent methyltransferase
MSTIADVDNTRRFTDRAEYYATCRPGYPDDVVEYLRREASLDSRAVVVDVGSGTGLSSQLFLRHGHAVHGVEPNPEMRRAAEELLLRRYPRFRSVEATAERTSLPDACADIVVMASAFHWFNPAAARAEFARILKPGGIVMVMGNGRRKDSSPFMRAYDELIRTYQVHTRAHGNRDENVRAFFAPRDDIRTDRMEYAELLDYHRLSGRTLSYSSIPLPGQPGHDDMMRELRRVFDEAAAAGRVRYEGQVTLYWGRLD